MVRTVCTNANASSTRPAILVTAPVYVALAITPATVEQRARMGGTEVIVSSCAIVRMAGCATQSMGRATAGKAGLQLTVLSDAPKTHTERYCVF